MQTVSELEAGTGTTGLLLAHECVGSLRSAVDTLETVVNCLALWFVPVLSVLGLVSNVGVCLVVSQRSTEINARGKLMYSAMAFADSLQILVNSIGRVFVIIGLKTDVGTRTTSTCRVHAFLSALTMGLSNGYAALFAVERCLAAYRVSTGRFSYLRLLWILAAVSLVQVFASAPFGWIIEVSPELHEWTPRRLCEVAPSALADMAFIVTELFTAYLPCLVLLSSDFALLAFLLRRRNMFKFAASSGCSSASVSLQPKAGVSVAKCRKQRVESVQMRAIIGNIKACMVMSSLRCVFLLSCIAFLQAYYAVLKFDGGLHPDHCVADLLYALAVLSFGASVLVFASSFYVLLWRVRAFKCGFWKLIQWLSSGVATTNNRSVNPATTTAA